MQNTFCLGENTESAEGNHGHCAEGGKAVRKRGLNKEVQSGGQLQASQKNACCEGAEFPVMSDTCR